MQSIRGVGSDRDITSPWRTSPFGAGKKWLRYSAGRESCALRWARLQRLVGSAKKKRQCKEEKYTNLVRETPEGEGTLEDYLHFGSLLGESVDSTLAQVQGKYRGMKLNEKSLELRNKLKAEEDQEKKLDDMMDEIASGEHAWKDSDPNNPTPMWSQSSKYTNAWNSLDFTVPLADEESYFLQNGIDYLEAMDDIPEDFSEEDFERMVSKIPEDLMDGSFTPPQYYDTHQQVTIPFPEGDQTSQGLHRPQEPPAPIPALVKPMHGVDVNDEAYTEPDFLGKLFEDKKKDEVVPNISRPKFPASKESQDTLESSHQQSRHAVPESRSDNLGTVDGVQPQTSIPELKQLKIQPNVQRKPEKRKNDSSKMKKSWGQGQNKAAVAKKAAPNTAADVKLQDPPKIRRK